MREGMNRATPGGRSVCVGRRRRAGERGLTLIEIIITIALLTIGVVGIAGGIASAEHIANISQNQAQLEVQMRQLSDWARDSTSTGMTYAWCASTSTYQTSINSAITGGALTRPAGVQLTVTHVYFSTSGFRNGASTAPLSGDTCSGTCPGATCVGDWGVQEITLKVSEPLTSGGVRSLSRTIWKGST
jgi:prepilin-type N-terminal cleavage/methylation domain-containing protein